MEKHTPGPWELDAGAGDITGKLGFSIPGSGGQDAWAIVARLAHNPDGNGALIAAAPDLLVALDWLVRNVRLPDDANPETWAAGYNRARAAISRARGEA